MKAISSLTSISFKGLPGSFSGLAAKQILGIAPTIRRDGVPEFSQIFARVVSGASDAGIIPLENSLAGSIHENYDLLRTSQVKIVAEHYLRVEHHLLGGGSLESVKKVYSYPIVFEQCRSFLAQYPDVEKLATTDTAAAAKIAAESGDKTIAAIGSAESAELYSLKVLKSHIEDRDNNFTRFVVITNEELAGELESAPSSTTKVSMIFALPHAPGSLVSVLSLLSQEGLNMTKIESRPIPEHPFEYYFYLDFEFAGTISPTVIGELQARTRDLKFLGIYPPAHISPVGALLNK